MLGRLAALCAAGSLALPAAATPAGGSYVFDGGTRAQRQTVVSALEASSFDWEVVPGPIVVHIVRGAAASGAAPGEIWLDADLLEAGKFAWGVVQHEYAHQVDYILLDDAQRARLLRLLGGRDWCYGLAGLAHSQYGCERFSSTLVWAYWPSQDNAYRPASARDESAAMAPAAFRSLMSKLVGAPRLAASKGTR